MLLSFPHYLLSHSSVVLSFPALRICFLHLSLADQKNSGHRSPQPINIHPSYISIRIALVLPWFTDFITFYKLKDLKKYNATILLDKLLGSSFIHSFSVSLAQQKVFWDIQGQELAFHRYLDVSVWEVSLVPECAGMFSVSEFQIIMLYCAAWFPEGIAVLIGALSHASFLKDNGLQRWSLW